MGNRLFIGNISFNTTEEALRDIFSQDGRTVTDAKVITDRETGRSRGFAFVSFGTDEEANSAIASWDGQELDGRVLRVNEAESKPPRASSGPRKSFGGGSGGDGGGPPEGPPKGDKAQRNRRQDRKNRRQQKEDW